MANKQTVADCPFLLNQWDYEENIELDIHKTYVNSHKSAQWHCRKCNYKWPGRIYNRHKAKGLCPVCDSGKCILTGYNDAFTLIPDLKDTYDFEKNEGFDIEQQGVNSDIRIWWKCKECGREWKTSIYSRKVKSAEGVLKATICPCQKIAIEGVNDIFTLVEGLKDYYDFENNKGVNVLSLKVGSNIPIHWNCKKCGHKWVSPIPGRINRVDDGYVARVCHKCYLNNKDRITPVASMPKLLEFWDFEKNTDKDINLTSVHLNEPAQWKCQKCGYEWETNIKGRTGGSGKCPYCEENQPVLYPGKNDILTLCPSASMYFDASKNEGIDFAQVYVSSTIDVDFKCPVCGLEKRAPLNSRISKKKDGSYHFKVCFCHHSRRRKQTYSEQYPRLNSIYNHDKNPKPLVEIKSTEITNKYHWICDICGETYYTFFNSVICAIKNTDTISCPYCSHNLPRKGESFADFHPELVAEYDESNTIDIYKVFPSSKREASWKCLNDSSHKWPATFAARHIGSDRCPICYPTMVKPGVNSLKAIYSDIANMWSDRNERTADEILYNSSLWVYLVCPECHMDFGTFLKDFISGKSECPYCTEKRVLPGVNSFQARYSELMKEWDHVNNYIIANPDAIGEKNNTQVWWICTNDYRHHYSMPVKERITYQNRHKESCPYCKGRRRKKRHFV